jgi:hypothetical protein
MSEEKDALTLVQEAQSPARFNLADVIKGRGFPEDSVTVYVDTESAYELSRINEELILIEDPAESAPLEAKIKELSEKILASKLIFHMRGIDQKQVELIEKQTRKEEGDEWLLDYFAGLVAANIVKVENATGEVDERPFTTQEVAELRWGLPSESWEILIGTMQKLTLASGYFKGLTDAGFLQKS